MYWIYDVFHANFNLPFKLMNLKNQVSIAFICTLAECILQ